MLTAEFRWSIFTELGELCCLPDEVCELMTLDDTLLALADPTRRAILRRLSRGAARVTELAEPFDISLNSVSKHIRMLERADLVRRRRAGREHFLTFNAAPFDELAEWMNVQRTLWMNRLDALDAMLQAGDRAVPSATKRRKKRSSR